MSLSRLLALFDHRDQKGLNSYLRKAIEQWFKYDNEKRIHESLDNLILRDICLWGGGNQENKRNNKTEFNQQKNF